MNDMAGDAVAPAAEGMAADGKNSANLVYILYLVGFVVPLVALVGLVLAYVNRGSGGAAVDSHYTFQIRTFWIGLLAMVIGAVTTLVLVGYIILLAWTVWAVVRIITGMQALARGQAVGDPTTWGFKA